MIRRAVTRPVSTLTVVGALVALGVFSLLQLPVSLLPPMDRPTVRITVDARDHSREQLLERWVEPLEPRLLSIDGATSVRALIGDGRAVLHLESDWFVDPDTLHVEVQRRLAEQGQEAGVEHSVDVQPADRSPVVEVVVTGGASAGVRTAFVEDLLVPELASLRGAARVEAVGTGAPHVVVRPRAAELTARGLTAADLVERLAPVGIPFPVGEVRRGARVGNLVVEQTVDSLEELRRLPLEGRAGPRLEDVAEVGLETVTSGGFVRYDGEEGVLVRVFRAPGANGVTLVRRVRERVAELDLRHPRLRLEVVHDRSAEIVRALELLGLAALIGLLAGALVLQWMLGSWRHALALAVIVPAAILASFTAFHLFGVSLNLISLSGLALAVGLLVDGSIVVLESIERARAAGEAEPVVTGTGRVAGAVVAAFLTTAVVFLPLVYLTGLARAFFGIQAFVLITALLYALLLSLTLTPVLDARVHRRRSAPRAARRPPGLEGYRRLLAAAVDRPWIVSLAAAATVLAGAFVFLLLPRELMPTAPGSEVRVEYRLPTALDDEARVALGRRLVDAVETAATSFGPIRVLAAQAPVDALAEPDRAAGEVVLRFASAEQARRALEHLRRQDPAVPGVPAEVALRPSALLEAARAAGGRQELVASAQTPEAARELAQRLAARLAEVPSLGRVTTPGSRERSVVHLWPSAAIAATLDPSELRRQVAAGLGEVRAGRVEMPGVEPEILVWPTRTARLELLPVGGDGSPVLPLGTWVSIGEIRRPEVVERQDGRWTSRVIVQPARTGGMPDLEPHLTEVELGEAESVRPGGEARELRRSFRQLTLLLVLSLALVFLTVTALYESGALSAVVMATVPLGLAGAAFLLALTGQSLNVMSFLGLVLLAGIVVNNSIILIHRAEQRRREGSTAREAVLAAAAERYRPILITTLTTLAGMLPLALLGGEGVELRRALSLAVVGGLATSTVASLLLVPSWYRAIHRGEAPSAP